AAAEPVRLSMTSRSRIVPAFLVAGGVLAIAIALVLAWGDRIKVHAVEVNPARGATNVPLAAPLSARFDTDMDRASVQARLAITPALPGDTAGPRTWGFRWATA